MRSGTGSKLRESCNSRVLSDTGPVAQPVSAGRVARLAVLLAVVLLLTMVFGSSSAFAATHRGVTGSIGSAGSSAGQLLEPQGVALNQSSKDLYVVDRGNHRIDEFESNGTFVRAWGWGVQDGLPAFEECTTLSTCQAGLSGSGAGQFASPEAIAVDNSGSVSDPSKEDVYVTDTTNNVVEKFDSEGKLLGQITAAAGGAAFKGLLGVAVDPNGGVWVYDAVNGERGEIIGYSDAVSNEFLSAVESLAGGFAEPGLAVDSEGHFYIGHRLSHKVAKLEHSGGLIAETVGGENVSAVTVDSSDNLYLNAGSLVEELSGAGSLIETFGELHPVSGAGIAVSSTAGGPVYVGNKAEDTVDVFTFGEGPEEAPKTEAAGEIAATSVTFHGELNPGGKSGKLEYQFDYNKGGSCTGGQSVPVPRGEVANASKAVVLAKATGLQPSAQYTFCLIALDPFGEVQGNEVSFETGPAPPAVLGESTVVPVKAHEATLRAKINPNNQETTYVFEYAENPALTGASTVPESEPPLSGFSPEGRQVAVSTGAVLNQGTTYYYRVLAKNASGEEAAGSVEHFTTAIFPETPEGKPASPVAAITATLNGVLNPGAEGNPGTYEFLYRQSASECQGEGEKTTGPQPATGEHAEAVKAEIGELLPHTAYTFCLRAHNQAGEESALGAPVTFTTLVALPRIEEAFVTDVTSASATLDATINPGGAPTTYTFEYAPPGGAFTPVLEPGGKGSLPEGTAGVPVSVHVQRGLAAATTYHFRLTVENTLTETEGKPIIGEEIAFTTRNTGEFALPDGRQWEMVSPAALHGALVLPLGGEGTGATTQAAAQGGAISFVTDSPTESQPAGYASLMMQVFSTRGSGGWSSQDVSIPHTAATSLAVQEVRTFSEDLSLALVQPISPFVPLSEAASEQTGYLRDNTTGAYTPLVTGCPATGPCAPAVEAHADVPPGTVFGQAQSLIGSGPCPPSKEYCGPQFVGATPDLKHVVLTASMPLKPGANTKALYEWSAGTPASEQLQLVSLLPPAKPGGEELPASNPYLGTYTLALHQRGAISADGSHVFFWINDKGVHLYMRDTIAHKTIQIDLPDPGCGTCGGGVQDPELEFASSDGNRVFFADTQKLTADGKAYPEKRNLVSGSASPEGADLYVCEIHEDACKLTDLTPSGSVLGALLGASKDGSWVYFVANGALAPGAVSGTCPNDNTGEGAPPTATCNLYVMHYEAGAGAWGAPRLVTVLSGFDSTDWSFLLFRLTARVSPNGKWLAFMSQRSLTGYDNRDAVSGKPDKEVYLYDAEHNRLTCASCDPSGARPTGAEYKLNMPLLGPEGFGETGTWLAGSIPAWVHYKELEALYQPRYLSDSGRLFFDSLDALVSKDVNGTGDVYEFEPAGVPAGPQACSAASASGGVVYRPAHAFEVEVEGKMQPGGQEGAGCVGLISSGGSSEESGFLDASEDGGDVFFISTATLSPLDVEGGRTVYDAHECTASSPCIPLPPARPPACTTEASCKAAPSPQPSIFGPSGSATFSGPGNPTSLPLKTAKTAAQLRAEKLARAMKACHKFKKRSRRHGCEKQAHGRYGAKATSRAKRAGNYRRAGR